MKRRKHLNFSNKSDYGRYIREKRDYVIGYFDSEVKVGDKVITFPPYTKHTNVTNLVITDVIRLSSSGESVYVYFHDENNNIKEYNRKFFIKATPEQVQYWSKL